MKTIAASLFFVLVAAATPAAARPFSDMFVFGGPLEDVGNFASLIGDLPPPFYRNRFSDGPLAVDVMAAHFGLRNEPSLHRIGPAVGNNFSSVDALASGHQPQDLAGQLDAYFASTGGRADGEALYYIIIGGNEVIAATYEPDDRASRQIVTAAVRAKEQAIRRLVAAGAKTILVPNFIDIGITPEIRLAGLAARGSKVSRLHNDLFARMLDRVEHRLDFHLIRFDFDRFVTDALASADILRFTNTADSCLALLPLGACDFAHFAFFNELFPTAKVHDLWGNALVLTVVRSVAGREGCPPHTKCSRK